MRKLSPSFAYCLLFLLLSIQFGCNGAGDTAGPGGETPVSKKLDIKIQVNGLQPGWVKLIGIMGSQNYLVDTIQVSPEGLISYQRDTVLPGGFYWVGLQGDTYIQVILDKDQEFSMETEVFGINASMQVNGSLDNQLLYENLQFEGQFKARFDSVSQTMKFQPEGTEAHTASEDFQDAMVEQRVAHIKHFKDQFPKSFFTIYKLAGQNPVLKEPLKADGSVDLKKQVYAYRNEFWKDVNMGDERLLRTPVVGNKLNRYLNELVDRNPDSLIKYTDWLIRKSQANDEMFKFVVNQIAIKYEKSDVMGGHAVFVHIVDNFFTDQLAFWSHQKELEGIRRLANEMRPSLLNGTAQDLTCFNMQGQKESLYDLKSKIVVLYLYSYSCEHCQERTPIMADVYKKWKNRGLDVFAFCTEVEDAPWRKFVQQYGTTQWHNVNDPKFESNFFKKYHIDITPEVYVIRNSDKKIIAKNLHPNQLPELLERELGS